jgi:hypothetical protein
MTKIIKIKKEYYYLKLFLNKVYKLNYSNEYYFKKPNNNLAF